MRYSPNWRDKMLKYIFLSAGISSLIPLAQLAIYKVIPSPFLIALWGLHFVIFSITKYYDMKRQENDLQAISSLKQKFEQFQVEYKHILNDNTLTNDEKYARIKEEKAKEQSNEQH